MDYQSFGSDVSYCNECTGQKNQRYGGDDTHVRAVAPRDLGELD